MLCYGTHFDIDPATDRTLKLENGDTGLYIFPIGLRGSNHNGNVMKCILMLFVEDKFDIVLLRDHNNHPTIMLGCRQNEYVIYNLGRQEWVYQFFEIRDWFIYIGKGKTLCNRYLSSVHHNFVEVLTLPDCKVPEKYHTVRRVVDFGSIPRTIKDVHYRGYFHGDYEGIVDFIDKMYDDYTPPYTFQRYFEMLDGLCDILQPYANSDYFVDLFVMIRQKAEERRISDNKHGNEPRTV
jgi:hypothetical protein